MVWKSEWKRIFPPYSLFILCSFLLYMSHQKRWGGGGERAMLYGDRDRGARSIHGMTRIVLESWNVDQCCLSPSYILITIRCRKRKMFFWIWCAWTVIEIMENQIRFYSNHKKHEPLFDVCLIIMQNKIFIKSFLKWRNESELVVVFYYRTIILVFSTDFFHWIVNI